MRQYKVKITKYSEQGALTNEVISKYADNPEAAKNICYEYDKEKYENNTKMYKVELYVLCYKYIDKNEFFAQFEA